MGKESKINELITAVKDYYEQKQTLEKKRAENDSQFLQALETLNSKKGQHFDSTTTTDTDTIKKDWEASKKIINEHKKQFKNILSQRKELVAKNISAKVEGYKHLKEIDAIPESINRSVDANSFNCLAHEIKHESFGPLILDIPFFGEFEVSSQLDTGINFGDNYFRFIEEVEGPNTYGFLQPDYLYYKYNSFLFIFTYSGFPFQNGMANFRASVLPNGGYYIWQGPVVGGSGSTSLRMNAWLDIAQFTPPGNLQMWQGSRKMIIDEIRESGSSHVQVTEGTSRRSGYLPEDMVVEHGQIRPIYHNVPYSITVGFETAMSVDNCGEALLDIDISVPMVGGDIIYWG